MGTGCSTIKSKGKLVEIIVQIIMTNRSLMRTEQPSFEQGDYLMNTRKQMFAFVLMPLNLPIMNIAVHRQISRPAVRTHRASWFDHLLDKSMKAVSICVGNASHSDSTDFLSRIFDCNGNQRLVFDLPTNLAFLFGTPICFIDFNSSTQAVSAGANHRSTEFVQPSP